MKRQHITALLVGAAVVVLAVWIMRHTYWDEIALPTTMRGEAARYPLYAAESLAQKLGARTSRDSVFPEPADNAVIFLSEWTWDLGSTRRAQLMRWVESGGRLVIDTSVYIQREAFQRWSGLEFFTPQISREERLRRAGDEAPCADWRQSGVAPIAADPVDRVYQVCGQGSWSRIRSSRRVQWALRDRDGMTAVRVAAGRGSVTAVAGRPFLGRDLLNGQHADLFVAVTQLRGGDRLHFLSEKSHPSLVTLTWRHGAPVIVLGSILLLLALWRNGTRFGPLLPAAPPLRRSLVEQIRGTGQFALRYGGGAALHAAVVRVTKGAAQRRISGFASMSAAEQAVAMAKAGSIAPDAMVAALQPMAQGPRSLLSTVALLESVRRRILSDNSRQTHGN